jgi:hypothetical protein
MFRPSLRKNLQTGEKLVANYARDCTLERGKKRSPLENCNFRLYLYQFTVQCHTNLGGMALAWGKQFILLV